MEVGDMVSIMEPNQPRREWLTVRITKTFRGEDRVVQVKTEKVEFNRTIQRLCLLVPAEGIKNPEILILGEYGANCKDF